MDSTFPILIPDSMDLTPFYNGQNSHSKVLRPEGSWRLKIEQLAEKKISWEECFNGHASLISKEIHHPAFLVQTAKGGQNILHLAIYQNQREWIDALFKVSSLARRRNKYGLTPAELGAFLGRLNAPSTSLLASLDIETTNYTDVLQKIEYLPFPQFESEKTFDLIVERSSKAKQDDLIPPEKIWMGIYFDQEIQKGYHPKISLRWLNGEVGFGVFTEERILSCNFTGEYTGIVRERKVKHLKDNYYCVRYNTWEKSFKKFIIDAEKSGNFTRFINHSESPNLGLQSIYWRGLPRLIFISLREIQKGEQLTFNYGNIFWKQCHQTAIPL